MVAPARLNLLVTHRDARKAATRNPWYETMTHLLTPLGVRTFEATTAPEAITLIERHPIHLAVVDTRLEGMGGQLGVLKLIQRLRDQTRAVEKTPSTPSTASFAEPENADQRTMPNDVPLGPFRIQVKVQSRPEGERIEVKFSGSPCGPQGSHVINPTVILLTPNRDDSLLQEALKCDAFSVMTEPVDLNLMLEIMARAMRRFHQNQWPQ